MPSDQELTRPGGELVRHEEEPKTIMGIIAAAAKDSRVDVAKMQALLALQIQISAQEAKVAYKAALGRLMPRIPRIQKNGTILNKDGNSVRSRFALYEDIDAIIRPILSEEGFSFSFNTDDSKQGYLKVTGTLSHRMGHSEDSSITLPLQSPVIQGAQLVGAISSFGKRYIVINMLNIVTIGEDTDGHSKEENEPISPDQVLTLETMMKDTHADRARFFKWLGIEGVDTLEKIPKSEFSRCVSSLQAKARKQ